MSNNYFDFLEQNAQQDKPANEEPKNDGTVNLTVRADAECQVVCDGDFLFLLNANQIVKRRPLPVSISCSSFLSITPISASKRLLTSQRPGRITS